MNKKITLFALLGILSLAPASYGQFFYLVQKQQNFVQTGNSTLTPDASNPDKFSVQISGGSQTDSNPTPPNQFTFPGNITPVSLNAPSTTQSGQWEYKQGFSSQSALDTAFPNGSYGLSFGSDTGNINLTGDLYPNAPVSGFNVAGTWNGNTYSIFAGQSLTITITFNGTFASGTDRLEEDGSPEFGNGNPSSLETDTGPSFSTSTLSLTIPGSELQAGDVWQVTADFDVIANITSIGSSTGLGLYSSKTEFQVAAIPEPAETVLILSSLALGAVLWRRRRVTA